MIYLVPHSSHGHMPLSIHFEMKIDRVCAEMMVQWHVICLHSEHHKSYLSKLKPLHIQYNQLVRTQTRKEQLWQDTCFEMFIFDNTGDNYVELHNDGKGNWNHLSFSGYRTPGKQSVLKNFLPLETKAYHTNQTSYTLQARWQVPQQMHISSQLKPACILYTAEGPSYWSNRHAPGRPDFHRQDHHMNSSLRGPT
ncbi:MAG: hypothetical protein OXT67_12860 [Zetaproteobacteria bacterium]|nr:hypothetical protein [Zetaproteobacteria bacterium]